MKKILFFLLCCTQLVQAETCPTIEAIKTHQFNNWGVYSIDNGTPLPAQAIEEFKQSISVFILAEWMPEAPEGTSHCYYGKDSQTYAQGYLAKSQLQPLITAGHWHDRNGSFQCFGKISDCPWESV